MAIACPRCGRHYDVTLFEYGRTIDCSCGERVALEHRIELAPRREAARFFADAMLERLARWLRLLGVDCAFERGIGDAELVRRAKDESRFILTRDRDLVRDWHVDGVVVLASGSTLEQLEDVVGRFDLSTHLDPFTRCSRCNAMLEAVTPGEVAARLPPRVAERHDQFFRCPVCERLYWPGTHVGRIHGLIARVTRGRDEP